MIEPLMNSRNELDDVETRIWIVSWEKLDRNLLTESGGVRLTGGVTLRQALARNAGTLPTMPRENTKWRNHGVESTNAWVRGGRVSMSGEGS